MKKKIFTIIIMFTIMFLPQTIIANDWESEKIDLINTDLLAFYGMEEYLNGNKDGDSIINVVSMAVSNASNSFEEKIKNYESESALLPETKEKNDIKKRILEYQNEILMENYFEIKAHITGRENLPEEGLRNRFYEIKMLYCVAMSSDGENFDELYNKITNLDFSK
ncbi:hypothetical protein ACQV2R_05135 [Facklamia sp. P12937]|uniref:hypothetical protein n=1 Tax=Facklamia sp. P12937 TaxID=3421949 RepID=UPI003D16EFCB